MYAKYTYFVCFPIIIWQTNLDEKLAVCCASGSFFLFILLFIYFEFICYSRRNSIEWAWERNIIYAASTCRGNFAKSIESTSTPHPFGICVVYEICFGKSNTIKLSLHTVNWCFLGEIFGKVYQFKSFFGDFQLIKNDPLPKAFTQMQTKENVLHSNRKKKKMSK